MTGSFIQDWVVKRSEIKSCMEKHLVLIGANQKRVWLWKIISWIKVYHDCWFQLLPLAYPNWQIDLTDFFHQSENAYSASDIVFKADGDFETWFQRENIENSSLWGGFKSMNSHDPHDGTHFTLSPVDNRFLYINKNWRGCKEAAGWPMVTFSNDLGGCPNWEHWWGLPGFEA